MEEWINKCIMRQAKQKGFLNSVVIVTASHPMADICQSDENALGFQPMLVTAQRSDIVVERILDSSDAD
jgi:hypothetical protein